MAENLQLSLEHNTQEIELSLEQSNREIPLSLSNSEGTNNYELLRNKPRINDIELVGNKTSKQLGVDTLSVQEIEKILYLG